ncbi:MAG: hypothetical protein GKS06_00910 [Acidobacteria bacterium]|nr:hypothetical protein [Acidobacteriota bacterium]
MKRSSSILLFLTAIAAVPAHAAVAGAQEQDADAQLERGEVVVTVETPTAAAVAATFDLGGRGTPAILLAEQPGQTLEDIEVTLNGARLDPVLSRRSSALGALTLPPDAVGSLTIRYRITGSEASAYRFTLPVPEATPSGDTDAVSLRVALPPGAAYAGNAFPPLVSGPQGLVASLVAVPSLVHVVFGDAGAELHQHRWLEALSLGVALALLLAGWWWHARRTSTAEAAA